MDALIPTINQLQDVLHTLGEEELVELPQIVVVGSQSSGKSSILENIVGKDFLPRGTGIVTRVPLVLQLVQTTEGEWATFQHADGKVFKDFDQVREEIEAQTSRITGPGKAISKEAIHLRVHSPKVVNLTLVDLPGLTKVPVGDQPKDIEQQLRDLVLHYIHSPNSLILAVSPANSDLANSDAIKIAKEVDPLGKRTLAIVTKLDLMDRGTDATDILNGKVIPVKLGIIGIVNRSQYDIDHNKSIDEALAAEQQFFQRHYPSMANRCGCAYLAKTLHHLLLHHIRDCLPKLKQKIKSMQSQTAARLKDLGTPLVDSAIKATTLLTAINRFADAVKASIKGTSGTTFTAEDNLPLSTGARLYDIFHRQFGGEVERMHALAQLDDSIIMEEIYNAAGPRPSLFVPESAFEAVAKRQIRKLEAPSLLCAEMVQEELGKVLRKCLAIKELARFRELRDAMLKTSQGYLMQRVPEVMTFIRNLIRIELGYINTDHPDFGGTSTILESFKAHEQEKAMLADPAMHLAASTVQAEPVMASTPEPKPENKPFSMWRSLPFGGRADQSAALDPSSPVMVPLDPSIDDSTVSELSPHHKMQVSVVRDLVQNYFEVVRKRVRDSVPKTVMTFMVNQLQEDLHSELVKTLYQPNMIESLLEEEPGLVEERKAAASKLKALDAAAAIVAKVSVESM
eukprot:TRINITY_DN12308_c2_g5_i11.p1 TRINITY_DN12308_c2_g5~~TRINITY_DN12308_c2_g5_i11.p1  ORF type:complete len:683 (+),score=194.46 TRINITY_DN12308_c2_g5_i11:19-2067(+)